MCIYGLFFPIFWLLISLSLMSIYRYPFIYLSSWDTDGDSVGGSNQHIRTCLSSLTVTEIKNTNKIDSLPKNESVKGEQMWMKILK